jgi:YVTN family beta-propeller protein
MTHEDETEQLGGAAPGPPGSGLSAGDEFAGHRIESELDRGGMGVVYRARHLALDVERALKVIAPSLSADRRFRARFRREARIAASLDHPNVITIQHAGEERGRLYLSMKLIEGADLTDVVESEGPLAPSRAASIVSQVAAGLDAVHASGLVHRDMKPSNVLLERTGEDERVYITDFGISRLTHGDDAVTTTSEFLGSPDYVAPEQIEGGHLDARADVYSLGGLAHYLLTGEQPFPRRSGPAKLIAHSAAPRPRPSAVLPGLPAAVDAVIGRAMAVRPENRFAGAGEFADAFGRALAGERPHRARREAGGFSGIWRWVAGALALAALAAVLILVVLDSGEGGEGGDTAGPTVSAIPVGETPAAVALGESQTWVASLADGAVWVLDPRDTSAEPQVVPTGGGRPISVAVGFNAVWVADSAGNDLVRLDARDPQSPPTRIPVGREPTDVVVDQGFVWVANEGDDTVSRVDPGTDEVDAEVPVGNAPHALAAGAGGIWVANLDDASISRIDRTGELSVDGPIDVGRRPTDLTVGAGSVWVVDSQGDRLRQIDPVSMSVEGSAIEVGSEPRGVAFGLGDVWVANSGDDTVSRIDAATGRAVGSEIEVGDDPADIAVGTISAWTENFGDDTVSRIDP